MYALKCGHCLGHGSEGGRTCCDAFCCVEGPLQRVAFIYYIGGCRFRKTSFCIFVLGVQVSQPLATGKSRWDSQVHHICPTVIVPKAKVDIDVIRTQGPRQKNKGPWAFPPDYKMVVWLFIFVPFLPHTCPAKTIHKRVFFPSVTELWKRALASWTRSSPNLFDISWSGFNAGSSVCATRLSNVGGLHIHLCQDLLQGAKNNWLVWDLNSRIGWYNLWRNLAWWLLWQWMRLLVHSGQI